MPTLADAKQSGEAVLHDAKQASKSPWVERLARLGYLVRGVVYLVIGLLALQLTIGAGGEITNPVSAVALIGEQAFGDILMVVMAVGLAGYSLWGFIRAIFDPLGRGTSVKGLMDRAAFLFSGISYALLTYPIVMSLMNKPGSAASQGAPTGLVDKPYGKVVIIAIGIIWLVAGVGQLLAAYRARFLRDLKTASMSADERRAAEVLGRVGYGARGVVAVLISVLIFETVFTGGSQAPPTFDGALVTLVHSAPGGVLLSLVALGLIMFGAFSALCAKWAKVSVGEA